VKAAISITSRGFDRDVAAGIAGSLAGDPKALGFSGDINGLDAILRCIEPPFLLASAACILYPKGRLESRVAGPFRGL